MADSVLSIYNGALSIVRHRPLVTVTDNTEGRRLCDVHYAKSKAWCLEQGLWNFALRTTMLEPSVTETPVFGANYAFEKPEDFVRLNAISGNAYFNPTLEHYVDEGPFWVADCDPLYVSYVSDDVAYGGDISNWPATFDLAVEHDLAYRIAPHLTSMGNDALVDLMKMRDRTIRDARSKDALNQPVSRPPPGRLSQSRMGSNRLSGRPWWR